MRRYRKVVKNLMRAVRPLTMIDDYASEALAVYLVGCAVSVLQDPSEERRQEIYGLLKQLVEKQAK